MKEITSLRTERNKTFDLTNGKRRLVCHCKPIHYQQKGRADWNDINLDFQDDGKGNFITDKNKVSIGFRKDLKLHKYLGVRYDYEHQFEATIKEIKIDSVEKITSDKIISLQRKSKTEITQQLNSEIEIINKINEVSLKNFVKVNNPIEDFKIVEELHLKGLTCSNEKKDSQFITDKYGRFNFMDENNKLKFWINPPFFEDKESSYHTLEHSLQEIDGKLIYTKTPTKQGQDDLLLAQYPILIDTNIYYSSTADGSVLIDDQDVSWDDTHDAQTGTSVDYTAHYFNEATKSYYNSKSGIWDLYRSFFYFDTSNLGSGATVTGAVLKIYGYGYAVSSVSAQEGTQADTLTTADFDAANPTPATGGGEFGHVSWVIDTYNSITFNDLGKGKVSKTGTTKICCREYTFDYLDSAPGADDNYRNGCWFSDEEGTDKDPRLEIDYTEGEAAVGYINYYTDGLNYVVQPV